MNATAERLRKLPFALSVELRDAAFDHGYRTDPEEANGWTFFRSTTARGEIALAAVSAEGPYFLSLFHQRVARCLLTELSFAKAAAPPARGHNAVIEFPDRDALRDGLSRCYQLAISLPTLPLEKFEEETRGLGNTEYDAIVRKRKGQQIFRQALDEYWKGRCPITGISDRELLRASHIVPWKKCENDYQRLSAFNGISLSAHWDAAFDKGLVSFEDSGQVLVSPSLSIEAAQVLNIDQAPSLTFEQETRENLGWHRLNIFKTD